MIFCLIASQAIADSNTLIKPGINLADSPQQNQVVEKAKCVTVVPQNSLSSQQPQPENHQPPPVDENSVTPSPNTDNHQPGEPPTNPPINQRFLVKKIVVRDHTIISAKEIAAITQPVEGKTVTLQELANVADQITALYLNRGYITSRAVLVDQIIDTGEIVIRVFEGGIDQIRVEGTQKINPEYICNRIRLAGLNPFRQQKLEDELILLRSDPIFKNLEASLRPADSGKFGQSTIIVKVTEASPVKFAVGVDNYSPPSVGSERLGVGLAYRNLVISGDQIAVAYNRSTTGGVNLSDFSYRVPLNAMNGTLQIRAAINNSKITDPQFQSLNIRGNSDLYEINYRQPLIRSPREELALSLGFTYQNGQTFLFDNQPFGFGIGADKNGVSRTSVFRFGQDYVKRDIQGAWTVRSLLNLGTGLFDATTNNHPIPDGHFFSWYGQVQRIQLLNQDQQLIIALDWQLTPDSLLPSQQFIIGGAQTVRGYRQNARSGDNGFRFSIEDQITVLRNEGGLPTLQFAPFIDLGMVGNHPDNPNNRSSPAQKFLASGGLGLLWQPIPNLNVRLDYGIPVINLSDRANNFQDSGFHFSVYYQP
ncbi:ShlB/FhaC/HecB family hemolysin secretion/activation protein [Fortiea contorta]|uniref:ShlB/FhaC/HecB family hemolysin secretion/activation protein n=1 Tax=Fortiea contorta TaxID=1892405 RepID=UPI000345DC92|nr:ShlB/FhaC/HecB family hemolysin secretion/activation protein [Fortiea contorta]